VSSQSAHDRPEEVIGLDGANATTKALSHRKDPIGNHQRWLRSLVRPVRLAARYLPLLAFFLVWELLSRSYPGIALVLPPPTDVAAAAYDLLSDGTLQTDVLASLKRVFIALALASAVGFPLGIALGASKTVKTLLGPLVDFFRPIPPLAWIPLSIVWFGIGDGQNEFIIFLAAVFPIVLNTTDGVEGVDRQLIRASQTLGARPLTVLTTVILPASLPAMFVGFRSATGIAWMALVAGELVASTSGLGFLISQGRMLFRSDFIIVGMLMIGLIGIALDGAVRLIQGLAMPWRER
jgi:ABC-type nitrate/sulfonate/bicarbonate transport system permease component